MFFHIRHIECCGVAYTFVYWVTCIFCTSLMQCNLGKSLNAFLDDIPLQPDPVRIAIVGCGCSVATVPVAEISHKWNISQVLHMHAHIDLDNVFSAQHVIC